MAFRKIKESLEAFRGSVPVATHEGKVRIGEYELTVHVLDNGERVIEMEALEGFFKYLENGGVLSEEDAKNLAAAIYAPIEEEKESSDGNGS